LGRSGRSPYLSLGDYSLLLQFQNTLYADEYDIEKPKWWLLQPPKVNEQD